ncbi:hypothetical protein, partial [Methylobacterium platani]|uniref:hypothetical protein n=1 Tax=Methylobacterium platani TaxID=427683 RepID=UPI001ADF2E59
MESPARRATAGRSGAAPAMGGAADGAVLVREGVDVDLDERAGIAGIGAAPDFPHHPVQVLAREAPRLPGDRRPTPPR